MNAWMTLFWFGVAYVFYTYFGYPLLLWLWRRAAGSRQSAAQTAQTGPAGPTPDARTPNTEHRTPNTEHPLVSIILTVRNERDNVGRKLQDLIGQDYSADRLEIWVASDQSTDGTNDVV